jgi:hypothetical protein
LEYPVLLPVQKLPMNTKAAYIRCPKLKKTSYASISTHYVSYFMSYSVYPKNVNCYIYILPCGGRN